MGVAQCPECAADVKTPADAVLGSIVECPDCAAELEIMGAAPLVLALAPEAEEDWGE
jgi:alpha-aminoadipate carrier protein LysW